MQQSFQVKTHQKQKLIFSQNLRASMSVLSSSTSELLKKVNQDLSENPFLEEREIKLEARERHLKAEFLEHNLLSKESLADSLQRQLVDISPPSELENALQDIVSSVDGNGFCRETHDQILQLYPHIKHRKKDIIFYLKHLEPLGVASEDLWQSLVWQAEVLYPKNYLLVDLIDILKLQKTSLIKFSSRELESLSSLLHISESALQENIDLLKTLDPFPVRQFESRKELLVPEIQILNSEENLEVKVRDDLLPSVIVNNDLYQKFQSSKADSGWERMHAEAENLINAIHYRGESLRNLSIELVKYQKEFFFNGTGHIKPMQLTMMAERLGVHSSTVSRIVSNKYLECDHGIFPLKYFFQNVLKTNDGLVRGVESLQHSILALVATEPPSGPYSDQALTFILQKRGFDIQRRTVTKYRKMLHIPAAAFRKVQNI